VENSFYNMIYCK